MSLIEYYKEIKNCSLFVYIPKKFHSSLLDHSKIIELEAGINFSSNEDLYILLDGNLDVIRKGSERRIEHIKPGRSIELGRFLSKKTYLHTWRPTSRCKLLQIDHTFVQKLFSHLPNTQKYLSNISNYAELHKLKRDLKLAGIDKKVITHLFLGVQQSKNISFDNSETQQIYIVKNGSVRCTFKGEGEKENIEIATLLPGDYFFLKKPLPINIEPSEDFDGLLIHCSNKLEQEIRNAIPILDRLNSAYIRTYQEAEIRKNFLQTGQSLQEDDDLFSVKNFQPSKKKLATNHKKKYIWFRQHDTMDCGAACLSMISIFYGRKINISTWRSLVHITREGASMLALKKAAERVGFDCIGVMTGYNALKKLQVPCVALMEYHYVVVYKVGEQNIWIADPASQLKKISKEDFTKEFSNNCLLIKPNEKLKNFPESKNSFLKYFSLFKDAQFRVFEITLISLVILLFGLVQPLFMQFVFDNVLVSLDEKYLRFIALFFIGILAVSSITDKVRGNLIASLTSKLTAKFNSLFLIHMLKLPLSYFEVRNVGDITTRIGELSKIRNFFSTKLVSTFINIFSFFLYAGILIIYDFRLLYVLTPFVPVLLLILRYLMKIAIENLNETFKASGKYQSMVFEHVSGIKTLKSISGIMAARWRWEETLVNLLKKRKEFDNISILLNATGNFFNEFIRYSLFMMGVYLYMKNQLTLGQVVAVHALGASIVQPLISLLQEWDEFNKIAVSIEKVDEIFTSKTEDIDFLKPPEKLNTKFKGNINFENIFFQYGSEHSPMVLNGINLKIDEGEIVAFVGASGSGKTTLAYMINQLYYPQKGKVYIDDCDISNIPLEELRENIAMINQDNQLFSGSIFENITIGDAKPDFNRSVQAAKMAHAHDFIMQKNGGYYFELRENGSGLSGGQKQRVNIARALYRNPNILIMDEATSSLDTKSEETILKNMRKRGKRTTIVIAHRLNTITHADKIFVFDQGHPVESGSHKNLLAQQGKYFYMFKKQLEMS